MWDSRPRLSEAETAEGGCPTPSFRSTYLLTVPRDALPALKLPLAKVVSSGSSSGYRRLFLFLTCLFENTIGRRMIAQHARLHLLVPATAGTGRFPPAIRPHAAQTLAQARAQLGRRGHLTQQRQQRL